MEVMRTGFGDIAVVFWGGEWPDSRTERSRTGGKMSEAGGWLERAGRRSRGICGELLKAGTEGADGWGRSCLDAVRLLRCGHGWEWRRVKRWPARPRKSDYRVRAKEGLAGGVQVRKLRAANEMVDEKKDGSWLEAAGGMCAEDVEAESVDGGRNAGPDRARHVRRPRLL